jgi:hypothetical protein
MRNTESDILLKSMLDKNLSEAKDLANFNGYNLNVVGNGSPICYNFDFFRINVYIEDGIVKKCYLG